jgi:quercetin dioxygenase-like cupin family protein
MTAIETAPLALLRDEQDLPFIHLMDGSTLQLLHVDLANGVWTVRNRFKAGTTITTHKHTGTVHAFTSSGSWYYLEYPDSVNRAGSYLFEPAGSVHTLHVPETNTEETDVFFTINGANLNLDEAGNVVFVLDAQLILGYYRQRCQEEHGLSDPPVIVVGAPE